MKFTMEISLEDERLVGTWAYRDEIAFVLSGVKRPAGEMSSISEDMLRQKPNVELVGVIADPARVVDVKDHEVYVQEGTDLTILNVTNPLLVRFKLCNLQERSHAVSVMDSTVYAFKSSTSRIRRLRVSPVPAGCRATRLVPWRQKVLWFSPRTGTAKQTPSNFTLLTSRSRPRLPC